MLITARVENAGDAHSRVLVERRRDVGGVGEPARRNTNRATIDRELSAAELGRLLQATDLVAELRNAQRAGCPVVSSTHDAGQASGGRRSECFEAPPSSHPSTADRSSQLTTVLALVGAAVGLSIVPAIAAARHNTPQCAYVPLVDHELQREIVAVWRRGSVCAPAAQAFAECVRDVVRGW
ncbi:MAG: LysR family transcriptional regulator substrate-binding protein [Gemmatimonadota bacterium]